MAEVQWFLLDLFFLGYVEDPSSGLSFKIPSELNWECYFEVKIHSMILQTCAVSPHPLRISIWDACTYGRNSRIL